jgi:hypothetical protein
MASGEVARSADGCFPFLDPAQMADQFAQIKQQERGSVRPRWTDVTAGRCQAEWM